MVRELAFNWKFVKGNFGERAAPPGALFNLLLAAIAAPLVVRVFFANLRKFVVIFIALTPKALTQLVLQIDRLRQTVKLP